MDGAREDLVASERLTVSLQEPHLGRLLECGFDVPRDVLPWYAVGVLWLLHQRNGLQKRLDVEDHRTRTDAIDLHRESVHARVAFVHGDLSTTMACHIRLTYSHCCEGLKRERNDSGFIDC